MPTGSRGITCTLALALAAIVAFAMAAPQASGKMRSKVLASGVCKTVGGGKFVRIPGSGGEKIDRRLLRDVKWMKRKYDIGIGDGYAPTGHAANGEHPIGAALDIWAGNGRKSGWNKIDRLAKKAEPKQNKPRLPWRWVGYNGDAGHGRGHHLHLSWAHSSNTTPRKPARWVLSRRCPKQPVNGDEGGGGVSARSAPLAGMAPAVPERE